MSPTDESAQTGSDVRRPRIPLGRAYDIAEPLLAFLATLPEVTAATSVGSLRRGLDTVGDVELVVTSHRPAAAAGVLAHSGRFEVVQRERDRVVLLVEGIDVGVRCVPTLEAGGHLLHLTGSRGHLAALRHRAALRGMSLGISGLRVGDRVHRPAASEHDVYDALGLPFIAPELREAGGEIEAAEAGLLPRLLDTGDLRGDLHMHTHWSDGRDSIEAMVAAAIALGYEYLAITDHSPNSAASRSLTLENVGQQRDEIAVLRERYPRITILHGCEVDILADGRLDFPDEVLAQFDIVLASLHDQHGHDPGRLMRRYESAMRHPLVAVITHPTNRLVPHRAGYDLDYDRLFEIARETGTVLEIDGAPSHLDLDGALARRAVAAGVRLSIDSDCHRADRLGRQMHFGVMLARRGWVPPESVINTRGVDAVRAHVAAKRSGYRP